MADTGCSPRLLPLPYMATLGLFDSHQGTSFDQWNTGGRNTYHRQEHIPSNRHRILHGAG